MASADEREAIEVESETTSPRPYDPDKIRVEPKSFSLRQILDMIDEKDLEIDPEFQRQRVWAFDQKSRLIESILLRIPLPAFYFSADESGHLQVVDGFQRLSTIHDFVRGGPNGDRKFALTGLEYLTSELEDKTIDQFPDRLWMRRIYNTQIVSHVIDSQTPVQVKFDIFKRINTGGTFLNAQEIRHALSSNTCRAFLLELSRMPMFVQATGGAFANDARMQDREVVLRFIAFHTYPGQRRYPEFNTMDAFLQAASLFLDESSSSARLQITKQFHSAMVNAYAIFGKNAFRKEFEGEDRLKPFNKALFDVWASLLAYEDVKSIQRRAKKIHQMAIAEMSTGELAEAASSGTGHPNKVESRFRIVRSILRRAR